MTDYLWCRKCNALVHWTEVDKDDSGVYSHIVISALTTAGEEKSIVHRGLVEED